MSNRRRSPISYQLTQAIAVIITIVWTASFIADIFIKEFDVNPFVHFAMMIVAGAAFGDSFLRKQTNGNGIR